MVVPCVCDLVLCSAPTSCQSYQITSSVERVLCLDETSSRTPLLLIPSLLNTVVCWATIWSQSFGKVSRFMWKCYKVGKNSVPVASTDARAHRCANPHWIPSTPWDSEHYQGWPLSSHIIAEWVLLQYSGYPHIKLLVQSARNGHEQPFVHLFKLSQGTSTSAPKNRENTQQPAPGMGC